MYRNLLNQKYFLLTLFFVCSLAYTANAQIKAGSNPKVIEASSLLELESSNKGLLLTRLSDTVAINSFNPPDGMIIFYKGSGPGKNKMMLRHYGHWADLLTGDSLSASLNMVAKNISSATPVIKVPVGGVGAVLQTTVIDLDTAALGHLLTGHPIVDSIAKLITLAPVKDSIISVVSQNIINNGRIDTVLSRTVTTNTLLKDSIISLVTNNTQIDSNTVKVITDSVTKNQALGDSIYMAVKNRADSLTGHSGLITINTKSGIDSALLAKADLDINVKKLAKDTAFSNTLAHDSSFVTTLAKDTLFNHTLANDSSFVTTLVKDTLFSKSLATDSVFTTTLGKDTSFIKSLAGSADSLTAHSGLITINTKSGIDSALLSKTDLDINVKALAKDTAFSNTLAHDSSFVTTLAKDTLFNHTLANDSSFVTTLVKDTLFSKGLATDSVFTTTLGKDTSFIKSLAGSADSLTGHSGLITINTKSGIDSALLAKADLDINVKKLAKDTAFSNTLAHDSSFVTTLVKDTLFSKSLATDSVFTTTLGKDTSFIKSLSGSADSLTGHSGLITINTKSGIDSALLAKADLDINVKKLAGDTAFTNVLGNDTSFIKTLTTNNQFRDSITNLIKDSALSYATNGVTKFGDTILLGGALNRPTIITTDATNTLQLAGLQSGNKAVDSLVTDSAGVLRHISPASIASATEPWYSTVTNTGALNNTDSVYIMGKVGIGTATPKYSLHVTTPVPTFGDVDIAAQANSVTQKPTIRAINDAMKQTQITIFNSSASGATRFNNTPGVPYKNLSSFYANGDNVVLDNQGTGNTYFALGNGLTSYVRATILNNGNMGIGQTPAAMNPTAQLVIDNNASTTNPALKLKYPYTGATTDSLLTWSGNDSTVRKITTTSLIGNTAWALLGNAGTTGGTNFVGTTDAQDLVFKTNGIYQMHIDSLGGVYIGDSLSSRGNSIANSGARLSVRTLSTDLSDGTQPKYAVQGIASGIFSTASANNAVRGGNFLGQVVVPAGITTTNWGSGSSTGLNVQAWRKGVINGVNDDASSVLAGLAGVIITSGNNGALGTTTNSYGIYMQPYALTGTITNMYGLYMDPANGSNYTNPWSLYINNSYKNYIQGNTGIGTNANLVARLTVDNNNNAAIPALKLKYPFDGAITDNILTWNGTDSTVRKVTTASLIGSTAWALTGNSIASGNFLGTTNDQDLVFKRNNVQSGWISSSSLASTAFGLNALPLTSTGFANTGIGFYSLGRNTSGGQNTAIGEYSLAGNTTGTDNTALGMQSLYAITSGSNSNTAVGRNALYGLTSGSNNVVMGSYAGTGLTTGSNNTFLGTSAGASLSAGSNNIAIGNNQNLVSVTGSNQLNIGGAIFGTGLTGSQNAPAGNIGINQTAPTNALHVTATANPLRLDGLQNGTSADSILVTSATSIGVVKKVAAGSVLSNNSLQYTITATDVTNGYATITASTIADYSATAKILLTIESDNTQTVVVKKGSKTATTFQVLLGAATAGDIINVFITK
jgi:hypothetical protein